MAKKKVTAKSTVKRKAPPKAVKKKLTPQRAAKKRPTPKFGSDSVAAKAKPGKSGSPPTAYWSRSSERALIEPLTEDLREAYDKLKASMVELGAQYVYPSAKAIMFAKERCYAFMRPKKSYVEVTIILDEKITDERLKRVEPSGKRFSHILHVTHADQVEEPLTDWLAEAYAQAPAGIPANFRGKGGGDEVEIVDEGGRSRGWRKKPEDYRVPEFQRVGDLANEDDERE